LEVAGDGRGYEVESFGSAREAFGNARQPFGNEVKLLGSGRGVREDRGRVVWEWAWGFGSGLDRFGSDPKYRRSDLKEVRTEREGRGR
jgi:hypothetical protein